jgi:prefoldin subunit 5
MKGTETIITLDETIQELKKEIKILNGRIQLKDEIIKKMQSEILDIKYELSVIDAQDLRW